MTSSQVKKIYQQVYKKGELDNITQKLKPNPLRVPGMRPNSAAVVGGFLGDEGKGRITDELTSLFLAKSKKVIHYRDNGGANAGHTVAVGDTKIALHQIGAGILQKGCTVISGKEMVLHPEDFVTELESVKQACQGKIPAKLIIDELAVLSLDTHRAYENALKTRASGSKGSTGRGIAPAYADVTYRHPLRMRDFVKSNWKEVFTQHYLLYRDLIKGLGGDLKTIEVARIDGSVVKVGTPQTFLNRLEKARQVLKPFIQPVSELLHKTWEKDTPIVFEKAQAMGLDIRWGVYPDVTASDCTLAGIFSSTQGIIDPELISLKAAVTKATYNSSVGARKLPSEMKGKLAQRIRDDAHEYGTTTGRPRDIIHVDIPMLSYLMKIGRIEYLVVTHLDISYPDVPIKICIGYQKNGKEVGYQPDQLFLNNVKPIWLELPSWDGASLTGITKPKDLPKEAQQYLAFLQQCLNVKILMATTGPKRDQSVMWF